MQSVRIPQQPSRESTPTRCLRRRVGSGLAAYTALSLGTACGSVAPAAELEQRGSNIIGGFRAGSAWLDHTGTFGTLNPRDGSVRWFCTATLIGPETVVTARHCVAGGEEAEQEGLMLAWIAGPDANSPLEVIPVASIETAPGDVGGYVGVGRDVAVLHLEHPSDISPAVPRAFGAELLGARLVNIGYGIYGARGALDGQRRVGRETVAAVEGRYAEAIYGSFENYVEWWLYSEVTDADVLASGSPIDPGTGAPADESLLRYLRGLYDRGVLLEGHEAVTGLASSDTQSCNGDSGGPYGLMGEDGVFETYGVVSGGLGSLRSTCDYGGVNSMFGPVSFAFLEREMQWVDPCGVETAVGRCEGDVARSCHTSFTAGFRRLVSEDCAARGLACVSSDAGVGCGTAPEPDLGNLPDDADVEAVVRAVQAASRPVLARGVSWLAGSAE